MQYNQPQTQQTSAANYVHGGLIMPNGRSPVGQQGSPWGSGAPDPTRPIQQQMSGTVEQAQQGLNYAAQQGWGQSLSPQQFQQMASSIGYAGGPVSNTMYNQGLAWLDQNLGARRNPNPDNGPERQPYNPQLGPQANPTQTHTAARNQLMQSILQNPQTMNQNVQDQMFEQQKEMQNQMLQQGQNSLGQSAVSRGLRAGSGQEQSAMAALRNNQVENLMGARRDIGLKAQQVNRQDELNALQQAMGMDQQEYAQGANNRQQSLAEWLGMVGAGQDQQRIDIGQNQFNSDLAMRYLQTMLQNDQFGRSLGQNQSQFIDSMGLNWAQMNSNNNNNFLRYLFGG